MKIKLDPWGILPTKAHETDAGFDLYAPDREIIPAGGAATINTGVHVQLPPGTAGLIVSKSGLNVKRGITSTGLIDCGYTGSIHVKLYNHGAEDYTVEAGDKISQLCVLRMMDVTLQLVDKLDDSARGDGGFGSSGR